MTGRKRRVKVFDDEDDGEDEEETPVESSDVESNAPGNQESGEWHPTVEKILGRKMIPKEGGQADEKQEMFLVKWKGLSYLHVSWETMEDICRIDHNGTQRIRRFFASPAFALQRELEGEDGEVDVEMEYFDPDYVEVQRIIACDRVDVLHAAATTLHELQQIVDNEPAPQEGEDELHYMVKWNGLPYNECTWEKWSDIKQDAVQAAWEFWQRQRPPADVTVGNNHPAIQEYKKVCCTTS